MELTIILDPFLWSLTGFVGSAMIALLTYGWLKGNQRERELKLKRRHV